jgi:hypothetical protein
MDEPVWMYIGIISVIVALGIIMALFMRNTEHMKEQAFENAFMTLGPNCDNVCASPPETRKPVDVDLPSGAVFYTTGQKICGRLNSDARCATCKCNLTAYTLDLNTSKETYDTHPFTCRMTRGEHDISIDCQG